MTDVLVVVSVFIFMFSSFIAARVCAAGVVDEHMFLREVLEWSRGAHFINPVRYQELPIRSNKMVKSLKTSYGVDHQVESFFTGQEILFDKSGDNFYCSYGSIVNRVSVEDGQVKAQITTKNEGDEVIRFTLTSDDRLIIIAYSSGLITKFNLIEDTIEREFKSIHSAPIAYLKINPSNTILATGSSDGTIKLWNLTNHYCSHNLKGINGVVSYMEFLETTNELLLFCSAGDNKIHMFDVGTSERLMKLSTHCSTITSMKLAPDGKKLLSVGRDKIAVFWNIDRESDSFGAVLRTIPLFECIESVILLESKLVNQLLQEDENRDGFYFATIGEEGVIKIWDANKGCKLYSQDEQTLPQDRSLGTQCLQLCSRPQHNQLCAVSSERNIFLYNLSDFSLSQQLQGHLDEILSACWFAKNKYLAIASNSNDLKIVEVSTSQTKHLAGHKDIILCVISPPTDPWCLITSSKDCTVLIWRFEPGSGMNARIEFKATGHTHAIYALATLYQEIVFFSGGEDTTLKKWSYAGRKKEAVRQDTEIQPLIAIQTIKAHDDRIDDLAISPNDQLIASASRDKTVKIFTVDGLRILGTLKGHRRGIHAVQFSPEDKVIVSAGDTTLRMWNLNDFTCVKTFQGHDCSVLNFTFLSNGLQMISMGSDGNMKIWDCKTNECIKTIDAHSGNTWALAITADDSKLVTGGQDEKLIVWRNTTEEEYEEQLTRLQTQVTQEQDFMNYINKKKWRKALKMAIKMENQSKTLNVMREIMLESDGLEELKGVLGKLSLDQIDFIVECCVGWTATARNSFIAQQILNILIRQLDSEQLLRMPNFISSLSQLKNLTEKSFNRYERLVQQANFVDFFLSSFRIQ